MAAVKFKPGQNFSQNGSQYLKLKLHLYLKYISQLNVEVANQRPLLTFSSGLYFKYKPNFNFKC
jgi:ABC-type microcin C transport system permease subunit YejE